MKRNETYTGNVKPKVIITIIKTPKTAFIETNESLLGRSRQYIQHQESDSYLSGWMKTASCCIVNINLDRPARSDFETRILWPAGWLSSDVFPSRERAQGRPRWSYDFSAVQKSEDKQAEFI